MRTVHLTRLLMAAGLCLCTLDVHAQATRLHVGEDVFNALKSGSARVIVTMDQPATRKSTDAAAAVARAQADVLSGLEPGSYRVVAQPSHLPVLSLDLDAGALAALLARPGVRAVTLDRERHLFDAQSHALTRVTEVHAAGAGGAGTRVAVIDSGINGTHLSLADDLVAEACFRTEGDCPAGTSGPGSARDQGGHGTHVSGIITGASGTAPEAEIIALKVFTTGNTSDTNIINALNAIAANHPAWGTDVVNMSLGGGNYPDQASCDADNPAYVTAFSTLNGLGISVFVATGNDADINNVSSPGCNSGAIGVGSVSDAVFSIGFSACTENGQPDKVTCFSNTTPTQGAGELLDILAPGCLITAEWIGSNTATNSICGTSMATPTVAGIAASLLSYDPSLTPAQVEALLEDTADIVTDYRNGIDYPRVNAAEAYAAIAITLPTPLNLTATGASSTQVDLDWTDVEGEDQYEIQRSRDGMAWGSIGTVGGNAVAFTDTAAACGANHYRVRAVDTASNGYSAFSNVDIETVRDCPGTPSALVANAVDSATVQLAWTDNATGETGFELERSVDSGLWVQIATPAADAEAHADTGFACGALSYRVRAVDAGAGDASEWSNVAGTNPCAPANDLIADAEPVPASALDEEASIRYATVSASDPAPTCRFSGPSRGSNNIWYSVNMPHAASLSVDTAQSDITGGGPAARNDTILAIYTGTPGALTEVACNDDIDAANTNYLSRIADFALVPGTTYHVLVTRWSNTPMSYDGTLRVNLVIDEGIMSDGFEGN